MGVQLKQSVEVLDTSTVVSVPRLGSRTEIKFGMQLLVLNGNVTNIWRIGRRSLPKLKHRKHGLKPRRTSNVGTKKWKSLSSVENVVLGKSVLAGDLFEDAELELVSHICQGTSGGGTHRRMLNEVVLPALERVDNRTMQENGARHLAHVLEAVCTTNT